MSRVVCLRLYIFQEVKKFLDIHVIETLCSNKRYCFWILQCQFHMTFSESSCLYLSSYFNRSIIIVFYFIVFCQLKSQFPYILLKCLASILISSAGLKVKRPEPKTFEFLTASQFIPFARHVSVDRGTLNVVLTLRKPINSFLSLVQLLPQHPCPKSTAKTFDGMYVVTTSLKTIKNKYILTDKRSTKMYPVTLPTYSKGHFN